MAFSANPAARRNFTFRQTAAGFLVAPGLPFVDILSEKLIARIFAKHGGLFGRTNLHLWVAICRWHFLKWRWVRWQIKLLSLVFPTLRTYPKTQENRG